MQYMLLIYGDPNRQSTEAEMQGYFDFTKVVRQRGAFISGEPLHPITSATSIRTAGGSRGLVTDGPFAETHEVLGGFYILECKDLDETIGYARMINAIDDSTVEIRPVMDFAMEKVTPGG
ncbi:MAG: YciI family protein [Anaerolineae bacterium]|nr:YciI family protein [Anaerolineae bacterium]